MNVEKFEHIYEQQKERILEEYFTFLKFKSISTEAEYKNDLIECCVWLENYIKEMGFDVERWETAWHPILFAHYDGAGPDKPTILLYHHYDVQPVDPIELWGSPPFEPTVRDGQVFARGAQDNKGQCFYTLSALRVLMEKEGKLPLNVKIVIEGEEEGGSVNLAKVAEEKKDKLAADYLAVVDLGIKGAEIPSIPLGFRGLVTFDAELSGSNTDLHSGSHGGIVFNPLHALVELFSKVRDTNGHIVIPGFYDGVKESSDEEKAELALDFDAEEYREQFAAEATGGESDRSPNESNWLRPTFEINGLEGGYHGKGFKTVIPAKATAKFSCRLVDGQDPKKISEIVKSFLMEKVSDGIDLKVHCHGGGPAVKTHSQKKGVKAARQAYSEVYRKPCLLNSEGGSIHVTYNLQRASGAEVLLLGLGLDTDQIHAPNEHFGLDRFKNGFVIISRLLQLLAEN